MYWPKNKMFQKPMVEPREFPSFRKVAESSGQPNFKVCDPGVGVAKNRGKVLG